ncbi:triose-phosphate isomerase [Natrarchaeobius sp. A-rgal3]|uniref:triose-phosphate isomerase n=1 Tax=Natrarchaeobius versutus TaxID=1679078 RepID=UPI00350FA1DA
MGLEYPHFLINFKTAGSAVGRDGLAFAETIDRVSADTGRQFVVSPHHSDVRLLAEHASLPIVAQSATPAATSETGAITCEAVAAAGADGIFVNHPENPTPFTALARTVDRCSELGLESIVCVTDRKTARAALALEADCLLFERPADVAADDATIRSDPGRIEAVVELVESVRPETAVFVGGGIRTAADVERAFDLGVDATGAASAALEADDREAWLRSIATAIPASLE